MFKNNIVARVLGRILSIILVAAGALPIGVLGSAIISGKYIWIYGM